MLLRVVPRLRPCLEDPSGVHWVGTDQGLDRFIVNEKFVHYLHDDGDKHSLNNNRVFAIREDRLGVIWVGTAGGGLSTFDRVRGIFTTVMKQTKCWTKWGMEFIRSIYEDRAGPMDWNGP